MLSLSLFPTNITHTYNKTKNKKGKRKGICCLLFSFLCFLSSWLLCGSGGVLFDVSEHSPNNEDEPIPLHDVEENSEDSDNVVAKVVLVDFGGIVDVGQNDEGVVNNSRKEIGQEEEWARPENVEFLVEMQKGSADFVGLIHDEDDAVAVVEKEQPDGSEDANNVMDQVRNIRVFNEGNDDEIHQ
jgi:hypothetical protein